MDEAPEPPDNEEHVEMERLVESGYAVIFSDGVFPGGRFQKVAAVLGGDLVLQEWRQDEIGNWFTTRSFFIIPKGTLPQLANVLRLCGYHVVPAP